jgi:hypothetical protein
MLSRFHVCGNLKSVHRASEGARVAHNTACAGGGIGVDASDRIGHSGREAASVLNAVSFPDVRKIPLPTRPPDFASRTCLASLNDVCDGFSRARAGGIGDYLEAAVVVRKGF